jgi:hypothetical protein
MGAAATKAHVDWLPHTDFVLEHPVEKVWPHIVDWDKWMPDKVCEHVSGPEDAVGEIKSILTFEDGKVVESIEAEIVRFEPDRRLAYRLLPLSEASGLDEVNSARGHMIFNIYALPPDRTLIAYESVIEMDSLSVGQDEFTSQFAEAEVAGTPHWLEKYVPELRRLLADGAKTGRS